MGATAGNTSFERLTGPDGLTYQPGLDGLRGLAVAVVVAFHLGFDRVSGGYLGVSLFFTLSGVLIGTLVLHEIVSTGRFSLRRFWMRRARRLLPPALVTLAVVAVGRLMTTALDGTSGTDIATSALDVANWHFLAQGTSYADMFTGPSAVLHFWSLAIEEQFYLVVGVFAVLLAARSRRPVLHTGLVAGTVAVCSFTLPLLLSPSIDRVYYGTDTRAGELMVGVAAAAVISSARRRRWLVARSRPVAAIASGGLLVTVGLWAAASPGTEAIGNGLLPVTAAASLAVIGGALMPNGPVAWLATAAPLRRLGRISYGVYLVHWPVIVVADRLTTDRSLLRSTFLVAITLAIAQLSAVLIELPVRRRLVPARRLAVAATVIAATIGVGWAAEGPTTESADLLQELTDQAGSIDDPGIGVPPPAAPAATQSSDLPRVALFGDSVAFSMLFALGQSEVEPAFVRAPSDVRLGCGIAVSPDQPRECANPAERYALRTVAGETDVAVMISCQWEVMAQRLAGNGDDVFVIGDPEFDAYIRNAYEEIADRLTDAGVDLILWQACPYMSRIVGIDALSPRYVQSRDPARVDRLNAIIAELAAHHPTVELFPFDEWMNQRVDDATIRPDGSHFEYRTPNEAADVFIEMVNETLEGRQVTQ